MQFASVFVSVVVSAVGCEIVAKLFFEQLLASVAVTVYVAAHNPETAAVFIPLLHEYAYGAVPPVATALALPLHALIQVALVTEGFETFRAKG